MSLRIEEYIATVFVVRAANGEYLRHQSGRAQWSWGPAEGMKIWARKAHAITAARKNSQWQKNTLRQSDDAVARGYSPWPNALHARDLLPLEVVELDIVQLAPSPEEGYDLGGEVRPEEEE